MTPTRLYLYAIVAGTHPPEPGLTGLAGAAVTLLPYRDLAAVVSAVAAEGPATGSGGVRPEPEQLLCHERVVETLMMQRSTLPVRFGTVLDAEGMLAILAERYVTLSADLTRLAGQVEIGLRILWDAETQPGMQSAGTSEPPAPAADPSTSSGHRPGDARPGTRYLLARSQEVAAERRRREAAQALEAWCLAQLGPLAHEHVTRLLATPAMPVSAAFLTPRANMAAFFAAATQMRDERPDLTLVCTGPWPPYHFVSK